MVKIPLFFFTIKHDIVKYLEKKKKKERNLTSKIPLIVVCENENENETIMEYLIKHIKQI